MKPKLLVLDDDPLIVRAHERGLKDVFEILPTHNVEAARLKAEDADAFLLDWEVGGQTSESLAIDFPKPTVIYTGSPHLVPVFLRTVAKPAGFPELIKALNDEIAKAQ